MTDRIDKNNIPRHVAIIMDGNGRWAKKRGYIRLFGHSNGVASVRETVEAAGEIGVKYLTLYAFSTENWSRPVDEVNGLMELLAKSIIEEVPELNRKNVSLGLIGDIKSFPEKIRDRLNQAVDITSKNTGLNLILALSYSSRWEIIEAVKKLAKDSAEGKVKPEDIDGKLFEQYLTTSDMPDPELVIRTSGEQRISNFLLWQVAYSEFYFPPILWPDFRKKDFFEAIVEYQSRERRFGKTGDQINK